MAESITGAQATLTITPASTAAQAVPDLFIATTSWKIDYTAEYEDQNDVGEWRTRRQQVAQKIAFSANGRETNGAKLALARAQQDAFTGTKGTAKYHIRVVGQGSDGKLDRWVKWATLDTAGVDNTGGNKGTTNSVAFMAEELG